MNREKAARFVFTGAFICITIGLLYSRFMISLGMLMFLLSALLNDKTFKLLRTFVQNKHYMALTLVFFIFLLSGLWSENTEYFLNRTRIKLPFLFLPYAFYAAPRLNKTQAYQLMLGFIAVVTASVLWSLFSFSLDLDHYIAIYGKGQILPTPIHHIRYSILVSVAVLFGIYMVHKNAFAQSKKIKITLVSTILFLIAYQHVLAVRSGLMTLYVVFFTVLALWVFKKQHLKKAVLAFTALIVLSALAVNYIPTIKNKIGYMKYSLEKFRDKDNIRDLSDSRRLGSIYAGLELIQEHPLLGVGIGDIMDETDSWLEKNYPQLTGLELLPHNQYILTGASCGLLLMLIFIGCSVYPLFYCGGGKDLLSLGTHLMFASSFMVEHTIESQIGVAAYIFIVLFVMKCMESNSTAHE